MRASKAQAALAALSVVAGCGGAEQAAEPGRDDDVVPNPVERDGGGRTDAARPMAARRPGTRVAIRDSQFDGMRQVAYAGQPLYYHAHESPGQVLCHDVKLNGGSWWVVGPYGKRRA